jgi:hypothetical protein
MLQIFYLIVGFLKSKLKNHVDFLIVLTVAIVGIGSCVIYVNLMNKKIGYYKTQLEDEKVKNQKLVDEIKRVGFENKTVIEKQKLKSKINLIDSKNNIVTKDSTIVDHSETIKNINVQTSKDVDKLNNLEKNHSYIITIH